jgi:hypothetical protein
MIDACRDNPFKANVKLANAGLAQIDAPPGTLVGFATAPGSTAADGTGRNGIYTKHLLQNLTKPGVQIEDAMKQVRAGVRADTRGRQTPWESTSLEAELILVPAPAGAKLARLAAAAHHVNAQRSIAIHAPPSYAVGDWWEWRITNELTGEVRSVRRNVVRVDGNGVTIDNGTQRDHFGNTLKERLAGKWRTYSPSAMFFLFPMTPGTHWSGQVTEGWDGYEGSSEVRLRVIGEEEIDTAMGRLRAIKLERVADWHNKRSGKTGSTRWVFWYHGPAKTGVRFERSNATSDGKILVKELQELTAFGSE